MDTDHGSELQVIRDALATLEGTARYGLTNYTHYPNGPGYFLWPVMTLGAREIMTYRLVPLFLGLASILALMVAWFRVTRSELARALGVVAIFAVAMQPGILRWMGGLHQHSYFVSWTLLGIVAGITGWKTRGAYLAVGFLLGWTGYDPVPVCMGALWATSFLRLSRDRDWKSALARASGETVFAAAGVILAVLSHLLQNALFYGSWTAAWNDLFGSAAARMSLESAKEMSPEYAEQLLALTPQKWTWPERFGLIWDHWEAFWYGGWVRRWGFFAWAVGVFILAATKLRKQPQEARIAFLQRAGVALGLLTIGNSLWFLFMPSHAVHHFHFVPRHFLMSAWIVGLLLAAAADPKWISLGTVKGAGTRSGARGPG